MRYKKGHLNQETGLVLWGYQKDKLLWMTKETFERQDAKVKAKAKAKYWLNLDENRLRLRVSRAKNVMERRQKFTEWAEKNKPKIRCGRLRRQYGLSNEDYHGMVVEQNNLCAICHNPQYGGEDRFLCVDHCHKTNKVRQLLCVKCNAGLGQFLDNPETLRKAAEYIEKHKQTLLKD